MMGVIIFSPKSLDSFANRDLGAMKVAAGTQAFMFETSLQLAVTKVFATHGCVE